MIELKKLNAGYGGKPVVQDVSLTFPMGQVTVLLGPNGCGKSTLLKAALGLIPAGREQVFYDGIPIERLSRRQVALKAALLSQNRFPAEIQAERLVLHGRDVCTARKPYCEKCCLREICKTGSNED